VVADRPYCPWKRAGMVILDVSDKDRPKHVSTLSVYPPLGSTIAVHSAVSLVGRANSQYSQPLVIRARRYHDVSRLLLSGATGMIGSLLTEALVARGVEFSVLLRPGDSGERSAGKPGVTSTEGDFSPSRGGPRR
jgi:hypothetical protein